MTTARKVVAYITHGARLLLLSHPESAEAGIQVPAGTLEPGESAAAGVLREATEETGLTDLALGRFLGRHCSELTTADGRALTVERLFYHVRCLHPSPPARWRHIERYGSDGGQHLFELYWAAYPDEVPALAGGFGRFLHALPHPSS